jgi:hypothetical protein
MTTEMTALSRLGGKRSGSYQTAFAFVVPQPFGAKADFSSPTLKPKETAMNIQMIPLNQLVASPANYSIYDDLIRCVLVDMIDHVLET